MRLLFSSWVKFCERLLKFQYSSRYEDYTGRTVYKKFFTDRFPILLLLLFAAALAIGSFTDADFSYKIALSANVCVRVTTAVCACDLLCFGVVRFRKS